MEAVKWFRKAAEQGYVDAQYNFGVCYDKGNGVAKIMLRLTNGTIWLLLKATSIAKRGCETLIVE